MGRHLGGRDEREKRGLVIGIESALKRGLERDGGMKGESIGASHLRMVMGGGGEGVGDVR